MISTVMFRLSLAVLAAGPFLSALQPAYAGNVRITPIGGHDGEFCRFDRALILEDPDCSMRLD